MKERPILFSGPMVRPILSGQKTQTRRVFKPQPDDDAKILLGELGTSFGVAYVGNSTSGGKVTRVPCPFGVPGDRLYVKETWAYADREERAVWYRADGEPEPEGYQIWDGKWKPSIFMPKSYSRITLEITDVRVERLQEITSEDVIAEGIEPFSNRYYNLSTDKDVFVKLWDSINGKKYPWESNPWVWVILFKRIT